MDRDEERSLEGTIQNATICSVDVQFRLTSVGEHRFLPDNTEGHDDEIIEDMCIEMHEDDDFFDIGAHIGIYSCVLGRKYPGIGIVCFEPHPYTGESGEEPPVERARRHGYGLRHLTFRWDNSVRHSPRHTRWDGRNSAYGAGPDYYHELVETAAPVR